MHLGIASSLAARMRPGYQIEFRNSLGATSTYAHRGGAGRMNSTSSRPVPTFVRFVPQGGVSPLEIHQSVKWQCVFGTLHEIDICVIRNHMHPSFAADSLLGATRFLGVECKDWRSPVSLSVGREAEWMVGALRLRKYAIVSTSERNFALANFLHAWGSNVMYLSDRGYGTKRVFRAADALAKFLVSRYRL
jgi:hypothetical protein